MTISTINGPAIRGLFFGFAAIAFVGFAPAATWVPAGGTSAWNNNANWSSPATFPNAAGDTADLTNDITAAQVIQLNQGIVVGTINFGDSNSTHSFEIQSGGSGSLTINNNASTAQLNNLRGSNSLHANLASSLVTFVGDVEVNVATGTGLTFFGNVGGNVLGGANFIKSGGGSLTLGRGVQYNYTGYTDIQAGDTLWGLFPNTTDLYIRSGAHVAPTDSAYKIASLQGGGEFRMANPGTTLVIGTSNPSTAVNTAVLTTGGEIRPGDLPGAPNTVGTITVGATPAPAGPAGGMRIESGSDLYFDIAGVGSNDKVQVVRVETRFDGGNLHINVLPGFYPVEGQSWIIWDAHTYDTGFLTDGTPGTPLFDSITATGLRGGRFELQIIPDPFNSRPNGRLQITYLPEPATAALLAIGAACLVRRHRPLNH